jgi:hypothetical protein
MGKAAARLSDKPDYHALIPPRSPTLPPRTIRRVVCAPLLVPFKVSVRALRERNVGNHADKTSPRCSMGCRGRGEKRRHLPFSHLETDFRDAQVIDFAGGIFRLVSYPLPDTFAPDLRGKTVPVFSGAGFWCGRWRMRDHRPRIRWWSRDHQAWSGTKHVS